MMVPLAIAIDEDDETASLESQVVPIVTADAEDVTAVTRQFDRRRLKWIFTRARRLGIEARDATRFSALDDVFLDDPDWLDRVWEK